MARDAESGDEVVAVRFNDGPLAEPGRTEVLDPGRAVVVPAHVVGWPPAERLIAYFPRPEMLGLVPVPEGGLERALATVDRSPGEAALYRRVRMSGLPDEAADSEHLMRGAEYEEEGVPRGPAAA